MVDFAQNLAELMPASAVTYRMHYYKDGVLITYPSPERVAIRCRPSFQYPLLTSGQYMVSFQDSNGLELTAGVPVHFSPLALQNEQSGPSTTINQQAEDALIGLDFDNSAQDQMDGRKSSELVRDVLGLYRGWMQTLGVRGSEELKIKTEHMELMAKATTKMLENQLTMLEMVSNRLEGLRTPPQAPAWEKIISAGAPAFAAMYVETLRAIKGTSVTPGTATDLLMPPDAKMAKLYELLGNVADADRLNVLLQDKDKLKLWMESVQSFIKSEPTKSKNAPSSIDESLPKSESAE